MRGSRKDSHFGQHLPSILGVHFGIIQLFDRKDLLCMERRKMVEGVSKGPSKPTSNAACQTHHPIASPLHPMNHTKTTLANTIHHLVQFKIRDGTVRFQAHGFTWLLRAIGVVCECWKLRIGRTGRDGGIRVGHVEDVRYIWWICWRFSSALSILEGADDFLSDRIVDMREMN